MRVLLFLILLTVAGLFACQSTEQPPTEDVNALYAPTDKTLLVRPNQDDGTVLRVVAVDSLTFTGVIVQTENDVLCDTVSAYKAEWSPCDTCTDGCQ